jgi:hypothetical protein
MSENCETANANMDQAILCLTWDIAPFDYAQGRLRQGGRLPIFFTKMLHEVQHFYEKDKNVPCCRRRIWLLSRETSGLHVNGVTPVI